MESNAQIDSPYLGPNSFGEDQSDRFFGRSAEIRELTSLVIARRVVLLYAQSGTGKTSLIKAGLIPALKRRDEIGILPIARVSAAGDTGERNPYVAGALSYLLTDGKAHDGTLREELRPLLADDSSDAPRLLILDQFEEIFTTYPERTGQRREFFQQLKECLEEFPQLTLLLSMREDYLASVLAYRSYLPDQLRTRMRLERLKYDHALAAVRGPAALKGKPFAPDVAEQLVDNLRRIQTAGGRIDTAVEGDRRLGEYVEPVQLQIVCWRLWEKLAKDATTITAADVQQHADVDDVLKSFYEGALAAARKQSGVSGRKLRQWFSKHLITPAKTRGLVYRGVKDTAGLPNAAVDSLEKSYLIRDARGGGEWYELTHDRLVEPILEANRESKLLSSNRRVWLVWAAGIPLGLYCIGLAVSAVGNRSLTDRMLTAKERLQAATAKDLQAAKEKAVDGMLTGCAVPSDASLQALDQLRQIMAQLRDYQKYGAPWSLRFGIYRGADLLPEARRAYYEGFRTLLFGQTQMGLVALMKSWTAVPGPQSEYPGAFFTLKAYLLTTSYSNRISSDPSLVDFLSSTLYQRWSRCSRVRVDESSAVHSQFGFYARDLMNGNPYSSEADVVLVQKSRLYLRQWGGGKRGYVQAAYQVELLGEVNRLGPSQSYNQRFPGTADVVVDSVPVPYAFTKDGYGHMKNVINQFSREVWVLADISDGLQDQAGVQDAYIKDYIDTWRNVLAQARFTGYAGLRDAEHKMSLINGELQPIVRLMCWTAQNTDIDLRTVKEAFAPVHFVTPSDGQSCASTRTQDYNDALRSLRVALKGVGTPGLDPAARAASVKLAKDEAQKKVEAILANLPADASASLKESIQRLMLQPILAYPTADPKR